MDWYSIGLAGASGGLAALIANLVFGKKPKKKIAYFILFAIIFIVFNTLSKKYILPGLNAHKAKSEIESVFESIPAFTSLKKYEPEIYHSFVNSLIETVKKGFNHQQAVDLMRSQMSGLVESRIPHASDDAIVEYMKVMVVEMGELQNQGSGLCYKMLLPKVGGGINVSKFFSKETQSRDLQRFAGSR